MKTFLVELTVDVDDDEEITSREIEKMLNDIDPKFGVVTVQNIQEE
jgi:hypothetical protein